MRIIADVREKQLVTCIPDVLNFKSLLYIGAAKTRQQTLHMFIEKDYNYTILEIWKPHIDWLKKHFKNVIAGDVRNANALEFGFFDVVMWWHGPEHIKEGELVLVLDRLMNMTNEVLITACPWGIYKSGAVRGNPYASHLSYLYPEFFEKLGWETNAIGKKDVRGSNLLAWWRSCVNS